MTTWVALLRGVNVGGKNLLPMRDLVRDLEEIGCLSVRTYIQSGNVVFRKSRTSAAQLAKLIAATVAERHGFQPAVHLLSAADLETAASLNPFPDATSDPKFLHLLFLAAKPRAARLKTLNEIKAASESYALVGNILYLHAPDGIGRSKLAARAEKSLGVEGTGRNWRTVCKLLELIRETA